MMAFALEDFQTLSPLYDPDFLRLYGVRQGKQDGVWIEKYFPLKPCQDAEFSNFYDYDNKETQTIVENLKSVN